MLICNFCNTFLALCFIYSYFLLKQFNLLLPYKTNVFILHREFHIKLSIYYIRK